MVSFPAQYRFIQGISETLPLHPISGLGSLKRARIEPPRGFGHH
jgi:hypothetical protein